MRSNYKNTDILIIGAGASGLACADVLNANSKKVLVIESQSCAGGLAQNTTINNCNIEKFYHHFFLTDKILLKLLTTLNLNSNIFWKKTPMGFIIDGKIHNFSTPFDILLLPRLSILSKLKLGLMIHKLRNISAIQAKKELAHITAKKYIINIAGKKVYQYIWKPLLTAKFGADESHISAQWLWGRIHPRAHSRVKGKEMLGYLKGGFGSIFNTYVEYLKEKNVQFSFNECAIRIDKHHSDSKNKNSFLITTNQGKIKANKIVFTGPLDYLQKLNNTIKAQLTQYYGVVCLIMALDKPLSKYYWINNADNRFSFGGIIEHTNFVSKKHYSNSSIVYVFKYLDQNSRFYKLSSKEQADIFIHELKYFFPTFPKIVDWKIHKTSHATPIFTTTFDSDSKTYITSEKNIYVCGMRQVYPFDRNINEALSVGQQCAREIILNKEDK